MTSTLKGSVMATARRPCSYQRGSTSCLFTKSAGTSPTTSAVTETEVRSSFSMPAWTARASISCA